jgi:glycosyltransferase involved in cell wall biosynthesis
MSTVCSACWVLPDIGHYHHGRMQAAAAARAVPCSILEIHGRSGFREFKARPREPRRYRVVLAGEEPGPAAPQATAPRPTAELRRRVVQTLDGLRPSVVFVNGWFDWGALTALRWGLRAGVPVVVMSESTAGDARRVWWKEAIKRRVTRLFSAGLVGGTPHREYLAQLGMPRERIFLGYDAVDNDHFAAGADAARADATAARIRLGLPDRYFLASNRFVEKKNLPRLIQAYASYCRAAGPGVWDLVLLGDGPLMPAVRGLVAGFGLQGHAHLPGLKSYDDLPAYYGLAGAFVHASTTEQWGLVVNEALAAGLPVVVSERCGCVADLVVDGRNGLTFDPEDVPALAERLAQVASDSCDRSAMGRAGRAIIADWSPARFADGFWRAAEAAANVPRPRPRLADRLLWPLLRSGSA